MAKAQAAAGTNAAATPARKRGGNPGTAPRAIRGSEKPSTTWTAAQEQAFTEQLQRREAALAERRGAFSAIMSLLMVGSKAEIQEVPGAQIDDGEGNLSQGPNTIQASGPQVIDAQQLLTNIETNGDALLTSLSKYFKLVPEKKAPAAAEGGDPAKVEDGDAKAE